MKKTIITLLVLAGSAVAAEVTWTGGAGDDNWSSTGNWSTDATPTSGDTIIINDGSSVIWDGTGGGVKYNDTTMWEITNGSVLTLGTKGPNTEAANQNPRFDGQFHIDATSSVTTHASFLKGVNHIYGTLTINNVFAPAVSGGVTLDFGEKGVVQFAEGSRNGIEGNGRTFAIDAVLNTGSIAEGASYSYTLEKRYLIAGNSDNNFDAGLWGNLTLTGGSITGADGLELTSALSSDPVLSGNNKYTTDELQATADNFGKYILGCDTSGIYVQYVKADIVPEPTTASLSLLALAGLAARRRRK